jgi:hypothetical protein
MPVVTLESGLVVGNFSSPHSFRFTTGEELLACGLDRVKAGSLDLVEYESPGPKGTINILLQVQLNERVRLMIAEAQESICDIVIAPLMVLTGMRAEGMDVGKFRTIRVADRVSKEIHPDRFCL